ncbi:MAG: hypothetical protein OXF42_04525 [Candidatus Dadabacteria bacterium]|nr:hypothetical protein [Candidatus Dadabacteria bacterium]
MARKMTPEEKTAYSRFFPNLDVNSAVVTGEANSDYNCIAWTLGFTTRKEWPGFYIEDFDNFYGLRGYVRASEGPIAALGRDETKMTHACVSGHGPGWESKIGIDLRIQHRLDELEGGIYGKVIAFYNKRVRFAESTEVYEVARVTEDRDVSIGRGQKDVIRRFVEQVDDETRSEFERRYSLWQTVCHAPPISFMSDPDSVKDTKTFWDLVEMGEKIIPLVVEKMTGKSGFSIISLYEELQPNKDLHFTDQASRFEGEMIRAKRTVARWIEVSQRG